MGAARTRRYPAARASLSLLELCRGAEFHQSCWRASRGGRAPSRHFDRVGPRDGHPVDAQDPRPSSQRLHHGGKARLHGSGRSIKVLRAAQFFSWHSEAGETDGFFQIYSTTVVLEYDRVAGLFVTGRDPLKATVIVSLAPGLDPAERSAHSPDAKRRLRRQGWRHQCSRLGPSSTPSLINRQGDLDLQLDKILLASWTTVDVKV
jgi:hypothetical protein